MRLAPVPSASFIIRHAVSLGLIALVLASCGGGGGGPAGPPPGFPALSNLVVTFGGPCTVSGVAGTALIGTVNYRDSDGNIRGGTLQTTVVFVPAGNSGDVIIPLPSANGTVTGTTEGTITGQGCLRFGAQTGITLSVAVVDAAGNSSNVVSSTVARPAGLPEVPRGATDGSFEAR